VPSAVSSSCSERETEVTQTTYQPRSPVACPATCGSQPETGYRLNVVSRSHYDLVPRMVGSMHVRIS
jgi:hypothetical protein